MPIASRVLPALSYSSFKVSSLILRFLIHFVKSLSWILDSNWPVFFLLPFQEDPVFKANSPKSSLDLTASPVKFPPLIIPLTPKLWEEWSKFLNFISSLALYKFLLGIWMTSLHQTNYILSSFLQHLLLLIVLYLFPPFHFFLTLHYLISPKSVLTMLPLILLPSVLWHKVSPWFHP
jgi:hypothetical protein